MLIHSVTPPHMLSEYPDSHAQPEMSVKTFSGGYIEGFETPQGFQISRLLSTNPEMYLDKRYVPGGIYKR